MQIIENSKVKEKVYIEKLENGNYELGVHIADVSHYVKEGTEIDKEAIKEGQAYTHQGK
mgnify:CR=1 FL=1